ncbi:MAG TPA: hypothetical protein VFA44_11630 [Gaiellaceae bacterium]|nr:hypothetical protein [Gaiellaceae bacterium]
MDSSESARIEDVAARPASILVGLQHPKPNEHMEPTLKLTGINRTVDPRRDLRQRQTTCRIRLAAALDDRAGDLEISQFLHNRTSIASHRRHKRTQNFSAIRQQLLLFRACPRPPPSHDYMPPVCNGTRKARAKVPVSVAGVAI